MGTYILLVNSTDQGAKGVREIPDRQAASRETARSLGIVRKNVYMTFGPYDFVQIIEAPSDEAVAKYVLTVNSKGNVRTTTMRAFDEAEHFAFLKDLP
jgi:uncharacterized protein with GYD domain